MVKKDLKRRTHETISRYDPDLLRRAAAFLYLKETHSSFEVEREKPGPDRAKRFADLLKDTESGIPISEGRFLQLQNAIVDSRFKEYSYRRKQVWVGQDLGYRKKVDFVPARPEDIPELMQGLIDFSEVLRTNPDNLDPIIAATTLAFGFVFIHPFMDGNGRIHRFLIHDVLSNSGFTPKGIVLPVSAVILANLDQYVNALETFSKPMQELTRYDPDGARATGNDAVYFRYYDATAQASFLYWALERTITHDLSEEISFLLGFDNAYDALKAVFDWPEHSLDLFIRLVHQNGGHLSKNKRESHFRWMTDHELKEWEQVVREAFKLESGRA
jgi:Fic/DOC family